MEKQRERRDLFETYRSQHLPLLSHGPSTFVYAWQNVGSRALGDRPRIYITEMIFAAKLFHRVQSGARRWLRISGTANTRRKHTWTHVRTAALILTQTDLRRDGSNEPRRKKFYNRNSYLNFAVAILREGVGGRRNRESRFERGGVSPREDKINSTLSPSQRYSNIERVRDPSRGSAHLSQSVTMTGHKYRNIF